MCESTLVNLLGENASYVDLLAGALKRFYEEDAAELYRGGPIDERAMVGCIARYIWHDKQSDKFSELEHDVDVEYNKMCDPDNGVLVKAFEQVADCVDGQCEQYNDCGRRIENRIKVKCDKFLKCRIVDCDRHLYRFRPDLIIHKRGACLGEGNGMIVEFKREGSKNSEIAFDRAKIMYCTCQKKGFKYKVGAFVLLQRDCAAIYLFANGQAVGSKLNVPQMNETTYMRDGEMA